MRIRGPRNLAGFGVLALLLAAVSLCLLAPPAGAAQVTPAAETPAALAPAHATHTPGGEVNIHLPSLERGASSASTGTSSCWAASR